ncbi:hypothetical protein ACF0H5_024539 [Mactra antiquata]
MLFYVYTVVVLTVLVEASPIHKYSDADLNEISTRLSRLKTLLQKINDVKSDSDVLEQPKYKHDVIDTELQADRQTHTDDDAAAVANGVDDDEQRLAMIKQFIHSLDDKELNKLKRLQKIADEDIVPRNKDDTTQDESKLTQIEVDSADENIQQSDLNHQLYDILQEEKKPEAVPAVVMKGKFVPSKDEIKYAVEKNLLTDVALAMHSGITINDILKDLIGQNPDSELQINKDDGQWLDKK